MCEEIERTSVSNKQNKIHGEQHISKACVYNRVLSHGRVRYHTKHRHEDINQSIFIEHVSVTDVTNALYANEFYPLFVFYIDSDWINQNNSSETTKERMSPRNQ